MADKTKFTIKKMFNGCPKPNGWFGCFAHIRGEYADIKVTGITDIKLTDRMQIEAVLEKVSEGEYKATEISVITKTKTGLMAYLASLPGVSRNTAVIIVSEYGENALEKIQKDPDNVKANLGLSDKQMNAILSGISNVTVKNKLRAFLPELRSPQMIDRVISYFNGADPIKAIKSDPYVLCKIPGITFKTADEVALRLGENPLSPYRVNHGLVYVLETALTNDLYVNLTDTNQLYKLQAAVEYTLNIKFSDLSEFAHRIMIFSGVQDSPIYLDNYNNETHLYLTPTYLAMQSVVYHIKNMNKKHAPFGLCATEIDAKITDYECRHNINLTKEQRHAVVKALSLRLTVITGGPGRGKTSVIDCIAHTWPSKVLLLAPTGKAMNKLKLATKSKFATMTIDRLIVSATFNSKKLLKKTIDEEWNASDTLVIIDESSMIDIVKASELLSCLNLCNFCFVGDVDQLPPINAGHFLKDMIDSKKIKTTYLTIPLRNSGTILSNADKINANDISLKYDFINMPFFPQKEDDQAALDAIIDQYKDELTDCGDVTQLALLCPTRKGIVGVKNLNIAIQDITCPENTGATPIYDNVRNQQTYITKGYPIPDTIYGDSTKYTRFRVGDIVMNTKNLNAIENIKYSNDDYWHGVPLERHAGIFNGDCGRIIAYTPSIPIKLDNGEWQYHSNITVQFFDGRIVDLDATVGDFVTFDLGYAMTVHKSQGCEYQTVIYVSPKALLHMTQSGFASKNLVYTAVTRAKSRVVLMGSKESLNACIQTNLPVRNSNVRDRF